MASRHRNSYRAPNRMLLMAARTSTVEAARGDDGQRASVGACVVGHVAAAAGDDGGGGGGGGRQRFP